MIRDNWATVFAFVGEVWLFARAGENRRRLESIKLDLKIDAICCHEGHMREFELAHRLVLSVFVWIERGMNLKILNQDSNWQLPSYAFFEGVENYSGLELQSKR